MNIGKIVQVIGPVVDIEFESGKLPQILNAVKIGMLRGNMEGLRKRYLTYYGPEMILFAFECTNASKLEKKTHIHFNKYCLHSELYDKKYLNEYVAYIEKHCQKN